MRIFLYCAHSDKTVFYCDVTVGVPVNGGKKSATQHGPYHAMSFCHRYLSFARKSCNAHELIVIDSCYFVMSEAKQRNISSLFIRFVFSIAITKQRKKPNTHNTRIRKRGLIRGAKLYRFFHISLHWYEYDISTSFRVLTIIVTSVIAC